MKPQRRSCNILELKLAPADAGTMEFSGYGAVFNNVDAYGDVIQPGAFTGFLSDVKSSAQQWPSMLLQHGGWGMMAEDMTPIGVWTDMSEDDNGLKVSGQFADTARGVEAYKLLKMSPRPAISGLSIGYYAKDYSYGGKSDPYERLLKSIDLVEISLVTFPANDKARVSGVKSGPDTERDFERLMQDAGFSRKEARIIMNSGYKSLKATQDAGSEELKQLASIIERNINILQN